MMRQQLMVREAANLIADSWGMKESPGEPDSRVKVLAASMIYSEFLEFLEASGVEAVRRPKDPQFFEDSPLLDVWNSDLVKVAHELGDLLYVVLWACCAYGIDIEPVFDEIQRANLQKRAKEGGGKWEKPEGFQPPNIWPIIGDQIRRAQLKDAIAEIDRLRREVEVEAEKRGLLEDFKAGRVEPFRDKDGKLEFVNFTLPEEIVIEDDGA